MTSLWPQIERILPRVSKPARYIGCEDGAVPPGPIENRVSWLLIYPDAYEIGLPNQGLQILYEVINERDDARAERAYSPWTDMEGEMRRRGLPLFSLESHRAAGDFDLLAFNLSAELVYTNLLNCVDLAGVPVRSERRREDHPLVVAGGHCTFNPEPLADYVDLFVIGDGEEVVGEITEGVREWKASGRTAGSRQRILHDLARVPGVYVPSCYDVAYDGPNLVSVTPRYSDVPERVEKRTIADLAAWPYPRRQLVPMTEVVHDRLNVEIFRGCTRGCRFCQAGMITRPVRERPADQVLEMVSSGLRRTGYDEVSLTSLSSADFSGIDGTIRSIIEDPQCGGDGSYPVSVSLPSLRVDAFTVGVAAEIQKARRTGLTFAPEAGTWRMRQVINKLITEEDLYAAVESAFSQGWRRVKLYFLTGLPTETDEDTLGIAELARNCVAVGRSHSRSASVTASVGGFVPKPQTPFQWFGQDTIGSLQHKIGSAARRHPPRQGGPAALARSQGVPGRGHRQSRRSPGRGRHRGGLAPGRDVPGVVGAFLAGPVDRSHGVVRPVDRLVCAPRTGPGRGAAVVARFGRTARGLPLAGMAGRSGRRPGTPDCRWTPCYDCGACTGYGLEHVVASTAAPAGGSQGTGQDLSRGSEVPVFVRPRIPAGARA